MGGYKEGGPKERCQEEEEVGGEGGRRRGKKNCQKSWKGVFNLLGIDDNTLSCPSNTSTLVIYW